MSCSRRRGKPWIQQIVCNLLALDHGLPGVGQFHFAWRFIGTKVSVLLNSNPPAHWWKLFRSNGGACFGSCPMNRGKDSALSALSG